MAWVKKGLIYSPNIDRAWSKSHAQVPTVDLISDNVLRIYYSSRDAQNRSHISYIEVNPKNPKEILYEHPEPILELGKLGAFDESGLMPSSVVTIKDIKYLYYTGWSIGKTVPYHNTIGLAVSDDGVNFRKAGEGPVLSTTLQEPYFIGTAEVMMLNGVWGCWYASCTGWELIDGKPEPRYHIKFAESKNGIDWIRNGAIAIDYKDQNEGGIVKATILVGEEYEMWFSYRGIKDYRFNSSNSYRIGYAHSQDGRQWVRRDEFAGLNVSKIGWDSQMVAYPSVFNIGNKKVMIYNGNAFGKEGFGYAEWEGSDEK